MWTSAVYFNLEFGASILPPNLATLTWILVAASMMTDLQISETPDCGTTITPVNIRILPEFRPATFNIAKWLIVSSDFLQNGMEFFL